LSKKTNILLSSKTFLFNNTRSVHVIKVQKATYWTFNWEQKVI
jgi:hypothetical protein